MLMSLLAGGCGGQAQACSRYLDASCRLTDRCSTLNKCGQHPSADDAAMNSCLKGLQEGRASVDDLNACAAEMDRQVGCTAVPIDHDPCVQAAKVF